MKFITAAIALLASAAVVTSLPVYDTTYSSSFDELYEPSTSTYDSSYETSTSTTDYYPTSTPDPGCEGFKITYPSESDVSWNEDSPQEVVFDFGSSKVKEVEYVDLVTYEDQEVVDQWATGPWNSSNPKTGPHSFHSSSGSGYYQFSVYAATEEHHHCTYLSVKFKVISNGQDYHAYRQGEDHHGEDYHGDDYSKTTTTPYDDATTTSDYWPTSTESESHDDSDFTPYQR